MKRITWLVGPPGSGKSTFAQHAQHGYTRVVEFNRMLFPLVAGTSINSGILAANHRLVQLIREVELRSENLAESPVMVVAGLVDRSVLFPVSELEEVWLLLPPREQWLHQFRNRPLDSNLSGSYAESYSDLAYSEQWYAEFETWEGLGLPIRKIDIQYQEGLIGRRHYD